MSTVNILGAKIFDRSHGLAGDDLKWATLAVAAAAGSTLAALFVPWLLAALVVVLIWILIVWYRPAWMFHLALITGFLALPSIVPTVISTPFGGLFLFEPALLGCVAASLIRKPHGPRMPWPLAFFVLICAGAVLLGTYVGNPLGPMIIDIRPLIDVILGVISGASILSFVKIKGLIKTSALILWASLLMTLGASFGFIELMGRSEVASLQGASVGAERLITPATFFALAVACAAFSGLVTKAVSGKDALTLVVPAVAILFVSFSRNNLVAVAVALFWAFLASGSAGSRISALLRLVFGAVLVSAVLGGALVLINADWLQTQINGFSERVIEGLTSEGISNDGSAQFRVQENELIQPVIGESPIWGHGFGAAYKAPYGPATYFTATTAPYYAHNYYLWLMLKGGGVLLLGFLVLVALPIITSFRTRNAGQVTITAVLLAFLAVSTVAPMPNGFPTAALFGLLLGGAYAATRKTASSIRNNRATPAKQFDQGPVPLRLSHTPLQLPEYRK
ncbi:O-antigen ligase family protein [Arthrobacter sp. M4]|uniref:O-antigen ligase family protein n=1 Tax=Arthrobacter sp. M4 TaxID=218160 RepID=UPI001CDD6F1E|nr:O-antigen ligase family protein [Arthrobacter sp. M4]MCA4133053.1 O-antigen ligase family protein [Arthrobacter sp. M4]